MTDILINDERYELHGWMEKKQVFVKEKNDPVILANLTNETINSYREFLINKLVDNLKKNIFSDKDNTETLTIITNYQKLKNYISNKLKRVRVN